MNVSLARTKKLARSLLRENRKNGRSWRCIAREDYQNRIDQSTLSRIARNKGAWLPKDETLLLLLGLKKQRKPRPKYKTIREMSNKELRMHIRNRTLPFALGWLKEIKP